MKTRLSLFVILLFALSSTAQTHIEVSNPDTWSAQELAPYVDGGLLELFESAHLHTAFVLRYEPSPAEQLGIQEYRQPQQRGKRDAQGRKRVPPVR